MAYASIPAVSVRSASACSVTASLQRVSAPPRIRTMAALQRRQGLASPSLRSRSSRALRVVCAAKPETVSTVCEIVKSQLALSDDKPLTPESKFSDLGADSLDTVEIVMALEEKFGISVEEENAGSITTVQEAADLIEKLIEARSLSSKA